MKKFSALLVALVATAGIVSIPGADAAPAKKKKNIAYKVKSGTTALTFDAGFIQGLVAAGVTPGPLAPGKLDGLTLILPIKSGSVNKKKKKLSVRTTGGQILTKNSDSSTREIINLVTTHKGTKTTVKGDAGGTILGVPGVTFLTGTGGKLVIKKKKATSTGVLKLSQEAVADLNTNFGTTFTVDTVVGSGKVVAKK